MYCRLDARNRSIWRPELLMNRYTRHAWEKTMEQRFSIVTLGVSDLKQSKEFYQWLGWRPSAASSKEIVFFQAGGAA